MPVIHQYIQRIDTPAPRAAVPGGLDVQDHTGFGRAVSAGFDAVAQSMIDREEERGRAWAVDSMSKSRLDWSTRLAELQNSTDPEATDFTKNFVEEFDAYSDDLVESAPTKSAGKFARERMAALRAELSEKALMFEAAAKIGWREGKFDSALDNGQKLMQTDPTQFKSALAEQLAVIDSSSMPPAKRAAAREKAINGMAFASVVAQINRSPSAFLNSIGMAGDNPNVMGRTGNDAFDMLSFDKRLDTLRQALSIKNSIDAEADKAADREMKRLEGDAMKTAYDKLSKGSLSREYIESIRPIISWNNYKSLLDAADPKSSEIKTDPGAWREIQRAVYSNNPKDAERLIYMYHRNGQLSNSDLSSSLSDVQRLDRLGGPKTEYERTRQRVIGNLDPGPLVQDPIGRGRLAEATYAFDDWMNRNPKATDKEIAARGQEIVNQYRFINLSDSVAGLPQPRFGSVRRAPGDPTGMLQDIAKSWEATKKAYADKKMSKEEYENEATNLNKWRKSIPN